MKLTWLGHACFLLEEQGYRIVTDPYDGVPGHAPLHVAAHAVFSSHDHFDHNADGFVSLLPKQEAPFTIREVQTFHDDKNGTLRGPNTIRIFSAGGRSVAHLGDLGHPLTPEQLTAIGPVDLALVPIGGTYTLDADGAKAVCDALRPRCIIPMHYRHGAYGFPELTDAAPFLSLWSPDAVTYLPDAVFDLSDHETGVFVPRFMGNQI